MDNSEAIKLLIEGMILGAAIVVIAYFSFIISLKNPLPSVGEKWSKKKTNPYLTQELRVVKILGVKKNDFGEYYIKFVAVKGSEISNNLVNNPDIMNRYDFVKEYVKFEEKPKK